MMADPEIPDRDSGLSVIYVDHETGDQQTVELVDYVLVVG